LFLKEVRPVDMSLPLRYAVSRWVTCGQKQLKECQISQTGGQVTARIIRRQTVEELTMMCSTVDIWVDCFRLKNSLLCIFTLPI